MDKLHQTLNAIHADTKTAKSHLTVFREFLAHLGEIQNKARSDKRDAPKPPPRRKGARPSRRR